MASADGDWRIRGRAREKGKSMAAPPRSRSSSMGKLQNQRAGSLDRIRARSSVMTSMGGERKIDFKAEKQKNIHQLLRYLTKLGYHDKVLTTKELQCPTTTVFLSIYSKLMELLCDQPVEWLAKPEDEIPRQMKIIGYPHQVTKSMIVSIAPHTWPQLLYALVWLCQLIDHIIAEPVVCEQSEYYMEQTRIFNGGNETDINEMLADIRSKNDPIKEQLDNQIKHFSKAKQALEKAEAESAYWARDVEEHEASLARYNQYIYEMSKYMENLDLRWKDLQEKFTAVKKLQDEKESVLRQYEIQFCKENLGPEEIEREKSEIGKLCSEKTQLEREHEQANEGNSRLEVEITRLHDELSKRVNKTNTLLAEWPSEDDSIVSVSLTSQEPLREQYIATVRPVIEYHHSKLYNPDQMCAKIDRLREQMRIFEKELAEEKTKLRLNKEGQLQFYKTKAAYLETRWDKQEQIIKKWNKFQIDFYTRKQEQLLKLQCQKRELDHLKSDAAFAAGMANFIQLDNEVCEIKSEMEQLQLQTVEET